ncbi:MAG: hypothetical protein ACFCUR_20255 [Rhodomicrobiaceae bacterium]
MERAGDEGPGNNGGTVVNLHEARQERPSHRGRAEPRPAESAGFEDELKRALDRTQFDGREFVAPARQPRNRPTYPTEAPPGQIRVPQQPNPRMRAAAPKVKIPPAQPATQQQAGRSGAKNLLAISLSAVVIGIAFYQIGNEWKKVNGIETAQEIPERFAPAVAAISREPVAEAERTALGLSPSAAPERGSGQADAAPAKDEASLLAPEPARIDDASTGGAGADTASMLEDTEQAMLKRGHDMIQQGHVSGARIIFEHLAEQSSPLGAFALAQSYDARFLRENGIEGTTPDEALAAKWYQRAAELTQSAAMNR